MTKTFSYIQKKEVYRNNFYTIYVILDMGFHGNYMSENIMPNTLNWCSNKWAFRAKSVRNRYVIEVFSDVFVLSRCVFDLSVGVGTFVMNTIESDLFLFPLMPWQRRLVLKNYFYHQCNGDQKNCQILNDTGSFNTRQFAIIQRADQSDYNLVN